MKKIVSVVLIMFATVSFSAQNIYVATDGNDESNSGTTPASPFKTVGKALSLLGAGGTEGTPITIHIAEGIYWNEKQIYQLIYGNAALRMFRT